MEELMMKCGHAANATNGAGKPLCVICMCYDIVDKKPSLEGRMAICSCGNEVPSSWSLPFFKYNEDKEHDEYYCGCYGWD